MPSSKERVKRKIRQIISVESNCPDGAAQKTLTPTECAVVDMYRSLDSYYDGLTIKERIFFKELIRVGQITVAVQAFLEPFADNLYEGGGVLFAKGKNNLALLCA